MLKLEWFKLLLLHDSDWPEHAKNSRLLQKADSDRRTTGKSAVDVYSKFLELLWDEKKHDALAEVLNTGGREHASMDLIFTVPATWSRRTEPEFAGRWKCRGSLDRFKPTKSR